MDGKTFVKYFALFLHLFKELKPLQLFDLAPDAWAEVVQHVDVNIIGLETQQLLVEEFFHVLVFVHIDHWAFRHKVSPVAVAASQRFADQLFAARIDVGRVKVVHAAVDRAANDVYGLRLVGGQPHAAEAEARHPHAGPAKIDIFHLSIPAFDSTVS